MNVDKPLICHSCLGLKYIQVKPEARAWLRRTDLDQPLEKAHGVRVYEMPDGTIYGLERPWRITIQCPVCNPRTYEQVQQRFRQRLG